jgi:hypothetical protein
VLAAAGGCLVTLYKPTPAPPKGGIQAASSAKAGLGLSPGSIGAARMPGNARL